MKNDILKFLASGEGNPQEQFNKALALYRKSKNHDNSQVRYMNSLGYSPARLEDLLYQLKKLHDISDLALANYRNQSKKESKKTEAKLEGERLDGALKLLRQAVEEIDFEKTDLEELKQCEEILNEEINRLPSDKIPEDIIDQMGELSQFIAARDAYEAEKVKQQKVDPSTQLKVTTEEKEALQDDEAVIDHEKQKVAAESEKAEFLKKDLGGFDVEAESYNSAKSFAATLSDYINEDPKDQKWDTIKDFISAAKKKHSKA